MAEHVIWLIDPATAPVGTSGHYVWPPQPALMLCPLDKKCHYFGCACARADPYLIPGALRAWYAAAWRQEKEADGAA